MTKRFLIFPASSPMRLFARDRRGNIAVIFAIALVPLLSFIGASIDYTRASGARTSMQTALDSAALMVSRENAAGQLTANQLTARAQQIFNALYTNGDGQNITVTANYSKSVSTGSTIQLTGSGTVPTKFMQVAGFPTLAIDTSSSTSWGMTRLRVALALDNTGSMGQSGKMPALQSAAKTLIDELSASANTNGDVYISIVPFANVVNFGTSFKNSGYIDWSNWSLTASLADHDDYVCGNKTRAPKNGTSGMMKCGSANNDINSWNGCVMDRGTNTSPGTASGPDLTSDPPTTAANYYPADQSGNCPQQIAPLSYDWASLKTVVNGMSPNGTTNQSIGLMWAWHTLLQQAPFNAPAEDTNYTYKKAIILLSDGDNTENRWNYFQAANIDARQKLLCDNIKAAGVALYTIQVNTDGSATSSVMQYCASAPENFFSTTTASGITTAFQQISAQLNKLRLAR